MSGNPSNIRVEPSIVTFGAAVAHVQTITTTADVAGSLNNKYFFLYAADGTKRHVWINIAAAGVDPAPAGFTAATVAGVSNVTAAALAASLNTAIDALDDFTSTVSGNVVTVTDVTTGYAPAIHDPSSGGSGFAFSVTALGDTAEELGCLDGDIEISFSAASVNVQCHEHGVTTVSSFQTGIEEVTVTLNMLETTTAKLKKILMKTQGSLIPVGAAGTEVLGIGTFMDFKNQLTFASKLVIHPKRLLAADLSYDVAAWKAIPQLSGLTFSAEGPVTMPIVFKCFIDTSKSTRANILAFGDHSQSVVGG